MTNFGTIYNRENKLGELAGRISLFSLTSVSSGARDTLILTTRSRKSRWPQNGVSPPGIRAAFWGVVVASWAEGDEIDGRSSRGIQAVEIRLVKTLPVSRIP